LIQSVFTARSTAFATTLLDVPISYAFPISRGGKCVVVATPLGLVLMHPARTQHKGIPRTYTIARFFMVSPPSVVGTMHSLVGAQSLLSPAFGYRGQSMGS
jgi:hypothetical protein